jgi:hypothetical protein
MKVSKESSYKFEGVPDYDRHCQWPFTSQEGHDAAALEMECGRRADRRHR